MLAGHRGAVTRIRQAGKAACTNMNARMPTAASGYSCAMGAHANAIRASALIASIQKVAPGSGFRVEALITRSDALS